jgi:hypothetical protein
LNCAWRFTALSTLNAAARVAAAAFSDESRRRAPLRGDKWRLDDVVISLAGAPIGSGEARGGLFSTL